jgi:hypothetical protein
MAAVSPCGLVEQVARCGPVEFGRRVKFEDGKPFVTAAANIPFSSTNPYSGNQVKRVPT